MSEQTYPANENVERALLGCFILNSNLIEKVKLFLSDDYFYYDKHKELYKEMKKIQKGFDLVILSNTGKFDKSFLTSCVDAVFYIDKWSLYFNEVRENYLKRRVLEISRQLQDDINSFPSLQKELSSITFQSNFAINPSMEDEIASFIDELESRKESDDYLKTGFIDFDNIVGGLRRGRIYLFAGRPGFGKSSFLLNMALNLAKDKKRSILFSLEMSISDLLLRLFSIETQIHSWKFERPKYLRMEEWLKVTNKAQDISSLPIVVNDKVSRIEDIEYIIQQEKYDIVFVDFIQNLSFSGSERDKLHQAITETMKRFKQIAKENNCAVVIASQTSRKFEDRVSLEPQLQDLKDSGGLEEYSDLVTFIVWQWKMKSKIKNREFSEEDKREVELYIAKNRFGPTGRIKLRFEFEIVQFQNLIKGENDE